MCYIAYLGIFLSERCRLLMSSSVSYFPKRHACNLSSTPAFPFLVCASSNHKNRDQSTKNNTTQNRAHNPQAVQTVSTQTSTFSRAESSLTLQTSRVDFEPHVESEEASEGLTFLEGFPYSFQRLRKSRKRTSNRASLGSEDCENREFVFLKRNKTHGSTRRSMSEQIIPDCLHRGLHRRPETRRGLMNLASAFGEGVRGGQEAARWLSLLQTLKRTCLDEYWMNIGIEAGRMGIAPNR